MLNALAGSLMGLVDKPLDMIVDHFIEQRKRRAQKRYISAQVKLGKKSAKLISWTHREELTDIRYPPINILPRCRDLESPLKAPVSIRGIPQVTFDQLQSHLGRLPVELRLAIYNELFTHRVVHLHCGYYPGDWRGGRTTESDWRKRNSNELLAQLRIQNLPSQWHFYHSMCPENRTYASSCAYWHWTEDGHDSHERCIYHVHGQNGTSEEPIDVQTLGGMGLLLSCRKIYTEVLPYLYSKNTFSFGCTTSQHDRRKSNQAPPKYQLLDLVLLSNLLLPRHFNLITSLDMNMQPVHRIPNDKARPEIARQLKHFDEETWDLWWNTLASMPHLQELYIRLTLWIFPPLIEEVFKAVMLPMHRMNNRPLSVFRLMVSWESFRLFRKVENPPYHHISFFGSGSNPTISNLVRDYREWEGDVGNPLSRTGEYWPIYDPSKHERGGFEG